MNNTAVAQPVEERSDSFERVVWVYEDGKRPPTPYTRRGYCTRCGDCCRKSWSYRRKCDANDKDARPADCPSDKKLEAADLAGFTVVENWDGYWVWWRRLDVPQALGCLAFEEPNVCKRFGEDGWPELCRKWPIIPEDLTGYPNCGFYFEPRLAAS